MSTEDPRSNIPYSQGHDKSVLAAHASRTIDSVAKFILPHIKPDSVLLDLGCGPGSVTAGFASLVSHGKVIGIDISPIAVSYAASTYPSHQHQNLSFQVGNILSLQGLDSIHSNSIDIVFTSQVFIHLPDPIRAFKEIYRILKPGGKVGTRECDSLEYYPYTPGLQLAQRGSHALIVSNGGQGFGKMRQLVPWAMQAGFKREKMVVGAGVDLYADAEKRKEWAKSRIARYEDDYGEKLKEAEIDGPGEEKEVKRKIGDDGLELMKKATKDWMEDDTGWCALLQCEVICEK